MSLEFGHVPDYGPEIVPGARVMNAEGRRGIVVSIRDRCHWNCDESAAQWRPRSAYVEWDGRHGAGYAEPESLSRIPAGWGAGTGLVHTASPARGRRPFGPGVVRLLLTSEGSATEQYEWWFMNNQAKGWASFGYPYRSWADLLSAWAVERGEPGVDEHGVFVNVLPAPSDPESVTPEGK